MKIRFLAASLEAQKDGVGDYTARLAAECAELGHDVESIGFNDKHISEIAATAHSLRLPQRLSPQERLDAFRQWEGSSVTPDWASLQFVPYGFHRKGFVHGWAQALLRMGGGAKQHVFFHEIWIGFRRSAPIKERVVGFLQKRQIRRLMEAIRPRLIHSSNESYTTILGNVGLKASVLPLFGNIPIAETMNESERSAFLAKLNVERRDRVCLAAIFGSIHPAWKPDAILTALIKACSERQKRLVVVSIGRIGAGEGHWQKMREDFGGSATFERMGELPPLEISKMLQEFDAGFCLSPFELLGKSGSTAALLDHGLRPIVSRFENAPEPKNPAPELITPSTINRLFEGERLPKRRSSRETAIRFVESLKCES